MYYENKSKFYVKQYGPAALIVLVSLLLISCGLFIATKAAKDGNIIESVAKENNSSIKTESLLPDELGKLETLKKSKEYKVKSINNDGSIVLTVNNKYYNIKLIGIEYSEKYSKLKSKMEKDLVNKKVSIAFDKEKENEKGIFAYVYLDDKLYNTKLLKKGYAVLRAERKNTDKLDTFLAAQIQARNSGLGVWED